MSQAVVHNLEVIEINEQNGKHVVRVALGVIKRAFQPVQKQGTIGQICQHIVEGVVSKSFLSPFSFGYVPAVDHEPFDVGIAKQVPGNGFRLNPSICCMLKTKLKGYGLAARLDYVSDPAAGQRVVVRVNEDSEILALYNRRR